MSLAIFGKLIAAHKNLLSSFWELSTVGVTLPTVHVSNIRYGHNPVIMKKKKNVNLLKFNANQRVQNIAKRVRYFYNI